MSGTTSALPSEADSISTAASALATISRNLTRKSPLAARPICVVRGGELTSGRASSRCDGLKTNDAPPRSASTTTNAVLFILMLNVGAALEFRPKADLRISIKDCKAVISGKSESDPRPETLEIGRPGVVAPSPQGRGRGEGEGTGRISARPQDFEMRGRAPPHRTLRFPFLPATLPIDQQIRTLIGCWQFRTLF